MPFFVAIKAKTLAAESICVFMRAFASAHSRGCECALSGLRLRTLGPASAHSFSYPSTGISAGGYHLVAFIVVFCVGLLAFGASTKPFTSLPPMLLAVEIV